MTICCIPQFGRGGNLNLLMTVAFLSSVGEAISVPINNVQAVLVNAPTRIPFRKRLQSDELNLCGKTILQLTEKTDRNSVNLQNDRLEAMTYVSGFGVGEVNAQSVT